MNEPRGLHWLAQIDWDETGHPGIYLHWLRRQQDSADVVAFIRMDPGCGYPRHQHQGVESVLVLQGGYRDEIGEHTCGDWVQYPAGSRHTPVALAGDDACILFATAVGGVELVDD